MFPLEYRLLFGLDVNLKALKKKEKKTKKPEDAVSRVTEKSMPLEPMT